MDNNQYEELMRRMDVIARLLTLSLPKEIDQNTKIEILSDMGLQPKIIGTILGITPNAVSISLHRLKKKSTIMGGSNV